VCSFLFRIFPEDLLVKRLYPGLVSHTGKKVYEQKGEACGRGVTPVCLAPPPPQYCLKWKNQLQGEGGRTCAMALVLADMNTNVLKMNLLLRTNLSRQTAGLEMSPCMPGQYSAARWCGVSSLNLPPGLPRPPGPM
jgi:hypothetical protein